MPEPFSLIEYPMVGGIDQHTDPRKVAGAMLLRAENAMQLKAGRWQTRYGLTTQTTTMLSGSALSSTFTTVHQHQDELLIAERVRLLGKSTEKDRLVAIDKMSEFYGRELPCPQIAGFIYNPDVACIVGAQDYICTVASGNNTTGTTSSQWHYATITDAASGTVIVNTTIMNAVLGYAPKVIAVQTFFIVVWSEGANIKARAIDMSAAAPAWGTITLLRNDHTGSNTVFDICTSVAAVDCWDLAYQTGAGVNRVVSVYRYNTALAQQATGTTADVQNADYQCIAACDSATVGKLGVIYTYQAGGNDIVRAAYQNSTTCANATAAFNVSSIASPIAGGMSYLACTLCEAPSNTFQVAWTKVIVTGAGPTREDDAIEAQTLTSGGAVTGVGRNLGGASLASKLLSANGTTYALVNVETQGSQTGTALGGTAAGVPLDNNIVMVNFRGEDPATDATPRPVCTLLPRAGTNTLHARLSHLPQMCAHPDPLTSYLGIYGEAQHATLLPTSEQSYRLILGKVTIEQSARQSCELGGLTYFSGGVPCWYDGVRVAEVGWLCSPNVTLTSSNGAGALDVGVVYQYAVVPVMVDAVGNTHRGIPWRKAITMGGADDTVAVCIPYIGVTCRWDTELAGASEFEVYRSEGGGTLLRLLVEKLADSPSTGTFTYTDLLADTALAAQPFLYDTSTPDGRSQLDHVNPPSARFCMTHRNRVWFAGCPNTKEIWISSKLVQREAPFFSEAFRILVDDGGDITGIASLDDKAVIFKDDRIFVVTGDGPDDSGNNSDWSDPQRVTGTVGCIDARSIVVTPIGIAFRSRVGLSLLTRGLEVEANWGAQVEDSLSGRTITAANVHKTLPEIRFLLDNGNELRFDYRHNLWTLATLPTVSSAPSVARWVGSTLYYLLTSTLYKEDTSLYTDNAAFVSMLLELAPVSQAGRLGMQSVNEFQALFDRYTAHDLKIEVSADGDSYPSSEACTWANANIVSIVSGTEYILSKRPAKATKSRIAKVRISGVTPSSGNVTTGQAFALVAAAFKVSVKEGPYKLLAADAKR